MTTRRNIDWPDEQIEDFCHRWRISELSIFGSVVREDFNVDSDVDMLYTFSPDARWSLLDVMDAEEEISRILGRRVDLVSRQAVANSRNWIRRRSILDSAERVYAEPG